MATSSNIDEDLIIINDNDDEPPIAKTDPNKRISITSSLQSSLANSPTKRKRFTQNETNIINSRSKSKQATTNDDEQVNINAENSNSNDGENVSHGKNQTSNTNNHAQSSKTVANAKPIKKTTKNNSNQENPENTNVDEQKFSQDASMISFNSFLIKVSFWECLFKKLKN